MERSSTQAMERGPELATENLNELLQLLQKREISSRLRLLAQLVAARTPDAADYTSAHLSPTKLTYRGVQYQR